MSPEQTDTARTYKFILKRFESVEKNLVEMLPELTSIEDYASITSIASILTQVKQKIIEFTNKEYQFDVPVGTFETGK